jgi:hypothetical protein
MSFSSSNKVFLRGFVKISLTIFSTLESLGNRPILIVEMMMMFFLMNKRSYLLLISRNLKYRI